MRPSGTSYLRPTLAISRKLGPPTLGFSFVGPPSTNSLDTENGLSFLVCVKKYKALRVKTAELINLFFTKFQRVLLCVGVQGLIHAGPFIFNFPIQLPLVRRLTTITSQGWPSRVDIFFTRRNLLSIKLQINCQVMTPSLAHQ